MTFASLALIEPLLRTLERLDYKTPTPVQTQAIPAVLAGRDLMAAAQTGTGKTAGLSRFGVFSHGCPAHPIKS